MSARANMTICAQQQFVLVFIDELVDDAFVFARAVGILAMIRFDQQITCKFAPYCDAL